MSDSPPRAGLRFHRALTANEMSTVKQVMRTEGGAAGFKALWSLILSEAEGVTWDEAVEQALRFHPSDYAIPRAQTDELLALMTEHRGRGDKPINVAMTWFNDGPSSYGD